MGDIYGIQFTAALSLVVATQLNFSSKRKRKRLFTEKVTAFTNALQIEFSNDDSEDSQSINPNDDAHQPSDVSHHQDDGTQKTDSALYAFANKPWSRPVRFGITLSTAPLFTHTVDPNRSQPPRLHSLLDATSTPHQGLLFNYHKLYTTCSCQGHSQIPVSSVYAAYLGCAS